MNNPVVKIKLLLYLGDRQELKFKGDYNEDYDPEKDYGDYYDYDYDKSKYDYNEEYDNKPTESGNVEIDNETRVEIIDSESANDKQESQVRMKIQRFNGNIFQCLNSFSSRVYVIFYR